MKLLLSYAAGIVTGVAVAITVFYFAFRSPKPEDMLTPAAAEKMLTSAAKRQSVELRSGRMLHVACPDGSALIEFTAFDPYAASYRWRFRAASGGAEQSGTGRVFERHDRIRTGSNSYEVKDRGSNTVVRAGSISLEWSYGSESSGWIYFYPKAHKISSHDSTNYDSFDLNLEH